MSRMRTIEKAAAELKAADPETALSEYMLRRLILSGQIPSVKPGGKYLVNMDVLERYLNNEPLPKLYGAGE